MDESEQVQHCSVKLPDPTVARNQFVERLNTLGKEGWQFTDLVPMPVGRTRINAVAFLTMPKKEPKIDAEFEYKVEELYYDTDTCNKKMRTHIVGGWRLCRAMAGGHGGRFLFGIYERKLEKNSGKKKGPVVKQPPAVHTAQPHPAAIAVAAAGAF